MGGVKGVVKGTVNKTPGLNKHDDKLISEITAVTISILFRLLLTITSLYKFFIISFVKVINLSIYHFKRYQNLSKFIFY